MLILNKKILQMLILNKETVKFYEELYIIITSDKTVINMTF